MCELKPCPFCGRKGIFQPRSNNCYYVACACGCSLNYVAGYKTQNMAIEAWNTRIRELLTDPIPLTLQQLKERDGQPVWVEYINDLKDQHLNKWVMYSYYQELCITVRKDGIEGKFSLYRKNYSKTWLAYDHEPRKDDK